MVVTFCLGMASVIKQSTCHKIDRPTGQIAVVASAEGCIVLALASLYFVMVSMTETIGSAKTGAEVIGFYQVPALLSALLMLVAVGLFAKSSTAVTYNMSGQSCAIPKDQKYVQSLDISAAVFSGLTVLTLFILIFRPWR